MEIRRLTYGDELWEPAMRCAQECSWRAGKNLAEKMRENDFSDWERVFAAVEEGSIAGYCTLAKTDCIPGVPYTPYIGFVFVGERYRGSRVSERLIAAALRYAGELGFDRAYLVSDHVNLYEKYGFVKIDEKPAPWDADTMETIFMHPT